MYARTPFRQIIKVYSAILAATNSLKRIDVAADVRQADTQAAITTVTDTIKSTASQVEARENRQAWALRQHTAMRASAELRREIALTMPDSPILSGWNSYAQCDEDGIIRECLRRIATKTPLNKTFIEIGCADGSENNTHQLLLDGFRGGWVDGDHAKIEAIHRMLGGTPSNLLRAEQCFVTLSTISKLISELKDFLGTEDIDFFTYDTDGNDAYLVPEALKLIRPKLLCVEYNAKFPPPTALKIAYDDGHYWAGDDFYGATLQEWVNILEGYKLVSCNLSGVNAFFVRQDLADAFTSYTTEQHYQPARHALVANKDHPASLKWLKQVITASVSPK